MGVTAIKKFTNTTKLVTYLHDTENPTHSGNFALAKPGTSVGCDLWIPWCIGSDQWKDHHAYVTWTTGDPADLDQKVIAGLWQNGDNVCWCTDNSWHSSGHLMPGESGVNGDRELIVGQNARGDWQLSMAIWYS